MRDDAQLLNVLNNKTPVFFHTRPPRLLSHVLMSHCFTQVNMRETSFSSLSLSVNHNDNDDSGYDKQIHPVECVRVAHGSESSELISISFSTSVCSSSIQQVVIVVVHQYE